jgi:hypothetical protein
LKTTFCQEVNPMEAFGPAVVLGLCFGMMFGFGCSLAVLYSIYLGGYRKAVGDSLLPEKSKRWRETLQKIEERRAQTAANSAKK